MENCPLFLGIGSFLSPGRALRLLAESALAIPTLRFSILCFVCSFRFREWIAIRVRHSSFSRGHPSGNARGEKCMCLTHPPVRALNRRETKGYGGLPRFWNTKLRLRFSRVVLFYLLFLIVRDTELRLHPIHEEISLLRHL